MITNIDEYIKVGVIFGNNKKLEPVWFVWNKKQYRIKQIAHTWMKKDMGTMLYCFSVTDGNALYELVFNAQMLNWKLAAVEAE